MTDYYDGPRRGMADFRGKPHLYISNWNETETDWCDYQLISMGSTVFELLLEEWSIWKRWETASKTGMASLETHPALPEERARYDEIQQVIKGFDIERGDFSCTAQGEFKTIPNPSDEELSFTGIQVSWRLIPTDSI